MYIESGAPSLETQTLTELVAEPKLFSLMVPGALGEKPSTIGDLPILGAVGVRLEQDEMPPSPRLVLVRDDTVLPSESTRQFRRDVLELAVPKIKTNIIGGEVRLSAGEPVTGYFVETHLYDEAVRLLARAHAIRRTARPISRLPTWYKDIRQGAALENPAVARSVASRELISYIMDTLPPKAA